MHFNFKFIMLVTTLILKYVYSTQFKGDYCFIQALNKDGVCTLISSCRSALKLFHSQRIFPQVCGLNKNRVPIVCCENNNVTITTTAPNKPLIEETTIPLIKTRIEITTPTISEESTTTPVETPTSTKNLQIGDKIRQKCQEYANYVYVTPFDFVLGMRYPPPLIAECEIVSIEKRKRSVGGTLARLKEFPHMALIGFERDGELHWLCGGTLISENYVLSVAHCQFIQNYGSPTYVLLGELTLNSETDGAKPQKIAIKRIIPHDEYISNERYNDIALYKLQHNAVLNPYVRPACLNTNSGRDIGLSIASGWGNSSVLEKVVLDMYTNDECNFVYRNWRNTTRRGISVDRQICAGSSAVGKPGDPLQIINLNEVFCTHIIVGINSFGRDCSMRDNLGVYTKVSHYIEWIESIVWS